MLKLDNLQPIEDFGLPQRISLKGAAGLTLEGIQQQLEECIAEYGVPCTFFMEQVQSGGLFHKTYEDCLCLSHPEHSNDYFKYCFRLSTTGNVAFITLNYFGSSTLTGKKNQELDRKNSNSLSKMALGAIFKTDQQAYEAEYNYYDLINSAIRDCFGI